MHTGERGGADLPFAVGHDYGSEEEPAASDYVLREVGTILKANCRPTDPLPIRHTGDEFVVFLHGDMPTAIAVAKRIRAAVAAAADLDSIIPGTPVTVSAGVAMLRLSRVVDTSARRRTRARIEHRVRGRPGRHRGRHTAAWRRTMRSAACPHSGAAARIERDSDGWYVFGTARRPPNA
jgi:hypothetical protein